MVFLRLFHMSGEGDHPSWRTSWHSPLSWEPVVFSWASSSICGGSASYLEDFLVFVIRLVACGFPWASLFSCEGAGVLLGGLLDLLGVVSLWCLELD